MSPKAPATLVVLLAQNFFLVLTLLLRAVITVFLLKEPDRGPALLLKVLLIFWKRQVNKVFKDTDKYYQQ